MLYIPVLKRNIPVLNRYKMPHYLRCRIKCMMMMMIRLMQQLLITPGQLFMRRRRRVDG